MNVSDAKYLAVFLLSVTTPAYAGTVIDFTVNANTGDFVIGTTSNVVSRQYNGAGSIEFSGNPQFTLATLSNVTAFSLNINWTAALDDGTTLFDNFSYGLSDLSWLYANFGPNYQPLTLSFMTNPTSFVSASPTGIVQKPLALGVQFEPWDNRDLSAFWIYPSGVATLGAVGSFALTTSGLPAGAPEPASWAMMIVGIAGVGAALRCRERIAVRYA
jgi:hypothetical protein